VFEVNALPGWGLAELEIVAGSDRSHGRRALGQRATDRRKGGTVVVL